MFYKNLIYIYSISIITHYYQYIIKTMILVDLIKQKLKEDLLSKLEDIDESLIDQTIHSIDIEQFFRSKLPKMINHRRNENSDLCHARVWSNHYGNRCSRCKINGTNYCIQHNNMINKYGYLSLGNINEEKPILNEEGKRIPWYNYEIFDMLNIIFEYTSFKIKTSVK
jgi:hypothetical protein